VPSVVIACGLLAGLYVDFNTNSHAQAPKTGTGNTGIDSPEEIVDRNNLKGAERFRGFYPFRANPRLPEGMVQDVPISRHPLRPGSVRDLLLRLPGPGGPSPTSTALFSSVVGYITPYRKDLLLRLQAKLPTSAKKESCVLLLTIARDGSLLKSEFSSEAENKTLKDSSKKSVLDAINSIEFAPLPSWFSGARLTFRIAFPLIDDPDQARSEQPAKGTSLEKKKQIN
jgi:hypothetical protein